MLGVEHQLTDLERQCRLQQQIMNVVLILGSHAPTKNWGGKGIYEGEDGPGGQLASLLQAVSSPFSCHP